MVARMARMSNVVAYARRGQEFGSAVSCSVIRGCAKIVASNTLHDCVPPARQVVTITTIYTCDSIDETPPGLDM